MTYPFTQFSAISSDIINLFIDMQVHFCSSTQFASVNDLPDKVLLKCLVMECYKELS